MLFKLIKYFLLITILSLNFSCGARKEKSSGAIFTMSSAAVITLGGGVYIWGENTLNGDKFARALSSNIETVKVIVSPGLWNFYAAGWTGDNGVLSGTLYCGMRQGVLFDGREIPVPLDMSTNCTDPNFGDSSYKIGEALKPLLVHACTGSGFAAASTITDCSSTNASPSAQSLRVITLNYDIDPVSHLPVMIGGNLVSPCVPITGGLAGFTGNAFLPVSRLGNNSFQVLFRFFDSAGCLETGVKRDFLFPNGIINNLTFTRIFASGSNTKLFFALP